MAMSDRPSIVVVGSVNLDIVATADRLPLAGETVTGAELNRFPGGKGGNQALAAKRLGADVSLVACVGKDSNANDALALLRDGGVDLSCCSTTDTAATGVALSAVAPSGENQIVVAPGANRELRSDKIAMPVADALICQLEVPSTTLVDVCAEFNGFICVNLAPAMEVPVELLRCADLLVVNETEADFYGNLLDESGGLVAKTLGAAGAKLLRQGEVIAAVTSPAVTALDTTGAGDTFSAALTIAMVEGQGHSAALKFACTAGAAAVIKAGAQPSLPFREEVEKLLLETE